MLHIATKRMEEQMTAKPMPGTPARTIDDAVRAVTAFQSFADLKDTSPTYAPTFYPRTAAHGGGTQELADMNRVCQAFNAWGARNGRREARVMGRAS